MKKLVFGIGYLVIISICVHIFKYSLNHEAVNAWKENESGTYGCTVQVENHLGETLQGVSFRLYKEKDGQVPVFYLSQLSSETGGEGSSDINSLHKTLFKGFWEILKKNQLENATNTCLETSSNYIGQLHFYGLKEGIYYLEETKVPDQYRILENRIEIRVDADSSEEGVDCYIVNGKVK